MAKQEDQQTMEEYLLSQLDTPVVLKAAQSDRFELSRQTGLRRKPKGKRKRTRITRIERINVGASPTQ